MVLQKESVDDELEYFKDIMEDRDDTSNPQSSNSLNSQRDGKELSIPGKEECDSDREDILSDVLRSKGKSENNEDQTQKPPGSTVPAGYNPRHREPSYCNADGVACWELTILASYVHPSVATMAWTILSGANIVYDDCSLSDLSLNAFLDKFMENKPKEEKKAEGGWYGGSPNCSGKKEEACYVGDEAGKKKTMMPGEEEESRRSSCELIDYHSLPSYLKDNEYILAYYRAEWPLKQTILSIFSIHNETLNIWTHLIGFIMFLFLTICTGLMMQRDTVEAIEFLGSLTLPAPMYIPLLSSKWQLPQGLAEYCIPQSLIIPAANDSSNPCFVMSMEAVRDANVETMTSSVQSVVEHVARWPFFAFMCGAMFCLLTSSACHLLSCHSKLYSYVMLRLDYAGISALIVTSFYPLVYYSFMCRPLFRNLYLGFITAFGVVTTLVSLVPIFQAPKYRAARSGLFALMGISGLVPIVHKAVVFGHRAEAVVTTGYEVAMGTFYLFGVVVYVTRVPERWMPGKFDLAGHSHQLFHLLVIAGACMHYLGGLVYLRWRETEGCY